MPGLLEAIAIAALGQLATIVRFHLAPAWDDWFIVALKVLRKSVLRRAALGFAPSAAAGMLSESWTKLAGSWRRVLPTGPIVLASIKSVEVRLGSSASGSRRPVPAVRALMAAKLKEIGVAAALPLATNIASLHLVEAESFFNEIAELVESGDTMIRLVNEISAGKSPRHRQVSQARPSAWLSDGVRDSQCGVVELQPDRRLSGKTKWVPRASSGRSRFLHGALESAGRS